MKLSARIVDSQQLSDKSSSEAPFAVLTPQEIICRLDDAIIGQDRAKQAVAVALWKQQLRANGNQSVPRSNLLLYGPTGCGKTALVREAANIVGLPFISFDSTSLTETGYRGRDAQDIIKDLESRFRNHPNLPWSVVFLDEFDKLAAVGNDTRMAYNQGTQHTLLKLVEGMEIACDNQILSTEGFLFVFGGAFTSLTAPQEAPKPKRPVGFLVDPHREDPSKESLRDIHKIGVSAFIDFGMEPELMGRVGQCVPLESLSGPQLKRILLDSRLSVYRKYQYFFRSQGVDLELSQSRMDDLIAQTVERGTGARGLNALVEELVEPLLLRLAEEQLQGRVNLGGQGHYVV